MAVSVVIPCYRSAEILPTLVGRIEAVLSPDTVFEVVLVVDGSPDQATWTAAADTAMRHDFVQVIRLARNYGQQNALIAGVRAARYETVVTMDDDLQHRPEDLPRMLAALTDDLDLIYGVSEREEHGVVRSMASRFVKAGLSRTMGVADARYISAFRVFRTFLRDGFDNVQGPHVSVDVALSWATTRVGAVSVQMDQRRSGRSGYTVRALMRHALNLIVGYSTRPLRLVTYFGFLIGVAGIALTVRVLWLYAAGDTTVAGFTTLASLVAIFSSAQMIAIGVVGEYVGRIHSHGMGRPTYVVRERIPARLDRTESAYVTLSEPRSTLPQQAWR
jgi:undecaprenyl-phosphate 4-deoxy-4-formamido-L-arabinose transferase